MGRLEGVYLQIEALKRSKAEKIDEARSLQRRIVKAEGEAKALREEAIQRDEKWRASDKWDRATIMAGYSVHNLAKDVLRMTEGKDILDAYYDVLLATKCLRKELDEALHVQAMGRGDGKGPTITGGGDGKGPKIIHGFARI